VTTNQTRTDLDAVVAAIRGHERFLVTTHENPDGDALGSLLLAGDIGDIAGNALSFAGLAFLVVGLAEAAGIFGRPAPEPARTAAEDT